MRIYYVDRKTGSICSVNELGKLIVSQKMSTDELMWRFERLASSTCVLLEEVEAIAARADRSGQQRQLGP